MEKDLDKCVSCGEKKRGGASAASDQKTRRAAGPSAQSLRDFILRLHTFARDWSQVASDDAQALCFAGMLDELAEVLREEYDKRHG